MSSNAQDRDMASDEPFYICKGNIFAVPVTHYNMEMAAQVRLAFQEIKPDCIAVELAETMQLQILHAASRLPELSIVLTYNKEHSPLYYLSEPCDAAFEALRSGIENNLPCWCIDLDVDFYPDMKENLPDAYAIQRIGLKNYYEAYKKLILDKGLQKGLLDNNREMHMARRLKELSLSHDRILFVGGMSHVENILKLVERSSFPEIKHATREVVELCTLTELSARDIMSEFGWISVSYEEKRAAAFARTHTGITDAEIFPPDRQKLIFNLLKEASLKYIERTGNSFPGYNRRNLMKFLRNYAIIRDRLMPDLYQILCASRGCVDDNFAYEVWELATNYPFRRNVDNLPELDLSIEDIWGVSKKLNFHLKSRSIKSMFAPKQRKDHSKTQFKPPGPFSICSYPPEDLIIEKFGEFLKKRGTQVMQEEGSRTIPFSTSLEDGVDTRETIRHWHEKKLYVKASGKPQGGVGSVVIIFDEDGDPEKMVLSDKYPWMTTWLGEHSQESDMSFYSTPVTQNVVGPGISRCEYGGFMMSYPPRRLMDVWRDPDYAECRSKAEVLLMAAIDYAVQPLITYVAAKPPRSAIKSYARRYGKKVVYLPLGQLSPVTLNKLRVFHVLDGNDKRGIAGEYIF
ncbi:MAG TPA: hypothetical protein VGP47_06030 [Parachlamydiaceae bacterium]|nr:hypothetical protein [Parachlamydiaceae bacterium]